MMYALLLQKTIQLLKKLGLITPAIYVPKINLQESGGFLIDSSSIGLGFL